MRIYVDGRGFGLRFEVLVRGIGPIFGHGTKIDGAPSLVGFNNILQGSYIILRNFFFKSGT